MAAIKPTAAVTEATIYSGIGDPDSSRCNPNNDNAAVSIPVEVKAPVTANAIIAIRYPIPSVRLFILAGRLLRK